LFVPCCAVGAQCRLPHTTLHTADMGGKVYGWSGGDAGEKKVIPFQSIPIGKLTALLFLAIVLVFVGGATKSQCLAADTRLC